MQDNLVNPEMGDVDLSKIAPLQQKRTLAFVNHFTTTTVQFLNNFMKICERKLMEFERKLNKVEAAVILLETRLASIPEVNTPNNTKEEKLPEKVPEPTDTTDNKENIDNEQTNENTDTEINVKESIPPEYERFIKMVQVGVPLQAVKLKATVEGLDPNILEKFLSKS